jgi:hypothetical protein
MQSRQLFYGSCNRTAALFAATTFSFSDGKLSSAAPCKTRLSPAVAIRNPLECPFDPPRRQRLRHAVLI